MQTMDRLCKRDSRSKDFDKKCRNSRTATVFHIKVTETEKKFLHIPYILLSARQGIPVRNHNGSFISPLFIVRP